MVSPWAFPASESRLQFQNGGRHRGDSAGWSSRVLLSEHQLFSLLNLDSTRGWEGQWTALGEDGRGKWGRRKGVSLWMGEGASSALRETLAPPCPGLLWACAPGVSAATVLAGPGRSAYRGREKWFLRGSKAPGLCGSPYDSLLGSPSVFFADSRWPFSLGAGGVNPTLALAPLALVVDVFLASSLGVFRCLGLRDHEAAKHWAQSRRSFFLSRFQGPFKMLPCLIKMVSAFRFSHSPRCSPRPSPPAPLCLPALPSLCFTCS